MDAIFWRHEVEYTIQEYIYDLKEPTNYWRKDRFQQEAYALWAANNVLQLLKDDPDGDIITIIERYANKMDNYACIKNKNSIMFSIAYDTAMDILDLVLAMM